jgi:GGDEF domain-containing protein
VSRLKDRMTSGWTDRHVVVALAVIGAGVTGVLTRAEPEPFHLAVGAALAVTTVLALPLTPFGGMVVGLGAAAAVIAGKRWWRVWDQQWFLVSMATTVALVVVGGLVGMAGSHLRERGRPGRPGPEPAYGSLGLLATDAALARLDEEIARARRHDRPLSVALLRTEITEPDLSASARTRAHRTVARLVESLLRDIDVPFAVEVAEVGAILPETDAEAAWELLGPLMDAASRASFTVREDNERRSLADCAELHAGLVSLSPEMGTADDLLAAVRRSVRDEVPLPTESAQGVAHGRHAR